MEKIIFFGLAIPILAFVLYLGGTAIMKGFEAKRENKSNESLEDQDHEDNLSDNNDKLTDELCKFMGKDTGSEIARTEVTQYLIQYIKDNKLQQEGNAKFIKPDKILKSLLGVKDKQEVTYFNLQGLMNKHFVKQGVSAEV